MPADTLTSDIDAFKEAALSCPHSRRGRADRREMGVSDPSRRAQRPPAFRGIPGGAWDCAQHPFGPPGEDGRGRDPRALGGSDRPPPGDLFADAPKARACCRSFWRCASGARNGAMARCRSSSPTGATASRCARSACRRMTAASCSFSDLTWIDRDGATIPIAVRGIETPKRSSSSATVSMICSESKPRSASKSLVSVGSIGRRLTFFSTSITACSMSGDVGMPGEGKNIIQEHAHARISPADPGFRQPQRHVTTWRR